VEVRIRPFFLALSVSTAAAVVLLAVVFLHGAGSGSPASLIRRLPTGEATVVYFDLAAVRSAGLLSQLEGVEVAPEREYLDFVDGTGFDYEQDLDSVLASFQEFETFMLLKGRFDWGRLRNYVRSHRGSCNNGFCQITGSSEDRQISFFAVTPDVMAIAVGADPWAATLLMEPNESPVGEVPAAPVWIMAPGSVLERAAWLPEGMRSFASQLVVANRVILSLSPAGSGFESRLRVDCPTVESAADLTTRFREITEAVVSLAGGQDPASDSTGLGDVLKNGEFRSEGATVTGIWPVSLSLLRAILGAAD